MNLQTLIHSDGAENTIIMMTGADLRRLIDDTNAWTRKVVEEQHQPRYFDIDDLMKLFKVGRTTIYNWMNSGKLPEYMTIDGTDKKLWDQAEIRDWVASGRVGKYKQIKPFKTIQL